MSKNQGLRFEACSPDHPRSSVWKLVSSTKKDDIYLGARGSMRMMKLSLRESGVWRYAFTYESRVSAIRRRDRTSSGKELTRMRPRYSRPRTATSKTISRVAPTSVAVSTISCHISRYR